MRVFTLCCTAVGATVASTLLVLPAAGVTVAADLAGPRWSSGTYDLDRNAFDCATRAACLVRLATTTDDAGCATEQVAPPGLTQNDTLCTASIVGQVTLTDTPAGCQLTALSSLVVTFNSGVSSVFNGQFRVSATFKPLDPYPVDAYAVTINDASPLLSPRTGFGSLVTSFRLTTNGIPSQCASQRRGTFHATANGTPSLTIAVG